MNHATLIDQSAGAFPGAAPRGPQSAGDNACRLRHSRPRHSRPRHSHFTMIPDLVGDLDLDPYAFRLYCHLCCVARIGAWDGGGAAAVPGAAACWQSTTTLARHCHMSAGKVGIAQQF